MATTTNEIKILPDFDYNSKTVTVQDASNYTGADLGNIASVNTDIRGLVKIVDPDGLTSYNNTNTASPDFSSSAKTATLDYTFDASSDVDTSTDEITVTGHGWSTGDEVIYYDNGGTALGGVTDGGTYYIIVVDANTVKLATSAANATAGTDVDITSKPSSENHILTQSVFSSTAHGFETGTPIIYKSLAVAGGLTDKTNYYAIRVDGNNFKVASSLSNAIAGTAIDITTFNTAVNHNFVYRGASISLPLTASGVPKTGVYQITMTLFDVDTPTTQYTRTIVCDYIYSRPTISFDITHSVINPIYFQSVDETSYNIGTITPTITRSHILYNPPSIGGNTSVTTKTLYTNSFYTTTSQVKLTATTSYHATDAYYSDATSVTTIGWLFGDTFSGTQDYTVDGTNSIADKYNCMKSMYDRMYDKRLTNRGDYERIKADFELAEANYFMMQIAIESDKSEDINQYANEIDRLTQCTSTSTATQVLGIGTTVPTTRRYAYTTTSSITSYTFLDSNGNAALIGYDYEDILCLLDGTALGNSSASLNSSTGTITFGVTVTSGVYVEVYLLR